MFSILNVELTPAKTWLVFTPRVRNARAPSCHVMKTSVSAPVLPPLGMRSS